jgi:hypothetical protein
VADKNFKVKSGLQVPSLTTAGPVTTDSAGNVTSSATLPISQGGTGQTTAGNALNAFLPLQTSQDNKFLQTNGVTTQWTTPQQHTATDGVLGSRVYSGTVTPSSPVTGDLWIDQTTGNGIQLVRWRKTVASATTTVTGLDDNNLTLSYTSGNEQVYINGVLITRGQDYTATNGTSVVLTQAAEVGDTLEIFGNPLFSVTDTYTQAQSNSIYVRNSNYQVAGKNKIINGDFGVNQRGFVSTTSTGSYTYDRWMSTLIGDGTTTLSSQAFIPGSAPISDYESINYLRAVTAGQTSTNTATLIKQKIEDVRTFANQTVTVSFWAKSFSGTPSISVEFVQVFGSGGSSAVNSIISSPIKKSINTAWNRYFYTITVPSILGKTIGANSTLELNIWLSAGSDFNARTGSLGIQLNTFDIWGVQAELGSVPTSFSTSEGTIYGELAACQRYYYRFVGSQTIGSTISNICNASMQSASNASGMFEYPVQMRVAPSFYVHPSAVGILQISGGFAFPSPLTLVANDNKRAMLKETTSGQTIGHGCILGLSNTINDYFELSAEL